MAYGQTSTLVATIRQVVANALAHMPDRELLKRFVEHDEQAAFEALMYRHGKMVLAVGRRILHDSHVAEDVFQATFLLLVRRASSLHCERSIGPWLHETARR